MNAVEIEEAVSSLAQEPFDPAEFPFTFLAAFDNKETTIKRLRKGETNATDVPNAVLQRNNIHLVVCQPGDVSKGLAALRLSPKTAAAKAKFIFATDGVTIEAEDVNSGETLATDLVDLPNHFGFFLPLAGISTVSEIKNNAIDIRATGRLNKLYIELLKENPEWSTPERRHDMNHFMARLIFCFFAEDTGIFLSEGLFTTIVTRMSSRDSSNTHEIISTLFATMNLRGPARATENIPSWADPFPYVNGGLFSGSAEVPRFSKMARTYLLHAGGLNWREINPDIFGSMIQAVADDEERGALGMHYTSVPNILKVLNPLFLDSLREQLEAAGDNSRMLLNLRKRISRIRVFDPACGSGNFLVIAYKQMRAIEAEINRRRKETDRRSDIPLTNFRGIELRDFPAEIARLALIIAEYQCDVLYRGQKEALKDVLPLDNENWITCGNALRLDWLSICPPSGTVVKHHADDLFHTPLDQAQIDFENEGGETYICGNPPYLGSKKKSSEQNDDMIAVGLSDARLLDYVCAFIFKGIGVLRHTNCGMALVSTSSICQGEQVALLWPKVLSVANIGFAYRPFKWANSAANNAGVWCTIVGIEAETRNSKMLYYDDQVRICTNISPYLVPGPNVICTPADNSISAVTKMKMGSNPVDGRRLILSLEEVQAIIANYPAAKRFFKRYGGTEELVSGTSRWCLWVENDDRHIASQIPPIRQIIENCRVYREGAGRDARKAASRPHAFCYSTYEDRSLVWVGSAIGNKLTCVPADLIPKGVVSSHTAFTIYGVALLEFSLITSTLHRVWAETVAGRLGNGTRYGNTTVYNTFPVPQLTDANKTELVKSAKNILLIREAHFPAPISDLYDPDKMPSDLREAHNHNDEAVERIYIGRRFRNDTERLEKLFDLYAKMAVSPPPTTNAQRRKAA